MIDGDVTTAEWGAQPSRPSLTFTLTNDAAYFAADLVRESKDGIWISLSSPVGALPRPGAFNDDHDLFEEENCKNKRLGTAELAECKADMALHAAFLAAHAARFERLYRLDRQGIRWLGKNGLEPVPAAVAASKRTQDGLTAEVKLPLAALPRMSEAPLSALFLAASAATDAKAPELAPEVRVKISALSPVAFEPYGAQREAIQKKTKGVGFSYHPAEPNKVEVVNFPDKARGGRLIQPTEKVLWEPLSKPGEVEVGYVRANETYLVTLKASVVLDLNQFVGEPMGFVKRGDRLHFFSHHSTFSDYTRSYYTYWNVKVVDALGKISEPIDVELDIGSLGWVHVEEFHTNDFTRFGLRGQVFVEPDPDVKPSPLSELEITWTFDKKSGRYTFKKRRFGVP